MKDRVSYESQVLYVGPTQTGTFGSQVLTGITPTQLHHVNRLESTLDTSTEVVYQYGSLDPVGTVRGGVMESTLEFEYHLADAQNEKWLGFDISSLDVPAASGMLQGINDEQNFYILTTKRGDAVTTASTPEFLEQEDISVSAFGNAVIENYYIRASLETIPSAVVSVNASNFSYASGASGILSPAITGSGCKSQETVIVPAPRATQLEVDALRPAYINMYFSSGNLPYGGVALPTGASRTDRISPCSLSDFTLNLQLPRRINQRLGSYYPISKPIKYPAQVLFSCSAKTKDIVSGNLMDFICSSGQDITIEMDNPYTENSNIALKIKNAYLDSHISQHDLLTNEFINLNFVSPLGSASGDSRGLFLSGVAAEPQETTYGISSAQLLSDTLATR